MWCCYFCILYDQHGTTIFFNAWVIMEEPRPRKLVCTFYVDKAWKEELRKRIGDITIEAEVYKLLRIVLQQQNGNMFLDCLHALLLRLKTGFKCEKFFEYVSKDWVPKKGPVGLLL